MCAAGVRCPRPRAAASDSESVRGGFTRAAVSRGVSVAPIAAVYGAIAGVASSPALVFALTRGSWSVSLACIVPPTAAAALIAGVLIPPLPSGLGPRLSMAVAIFVYVLTAALRGAFMWRGPLRRRGECAECGYNRAGLPRAARCPVCGQRPTVLVYKPPPPKRAANRHTYRSGTPTNRTVPTTSPPDPPRRISAVNVAGPGGSGSP